MRWAPSDLLWTENLRNNIAWWSLFHKIELQRLKKEGESCCAHIPTGARLTQLPPEQSVLRPAALRGTLEFSIFLFFNDGG